MEKMQNIVIGGSTPTSCRSPSRSSTTTSRCFASGRSANQTGYAAMCKHVAAWPKRTSAVVGGNGAGRPLVQWLLGDGEHVVDVPAKLAARARMLDTRHGCKTDAYDAHSVAVAAVRARESRVLAHDPELEALRMLTDHRDELVRRRLQTVNRLQRLLAELIPARGRRTSPPCRPRRYWLRCRPRDVVGKTRRRLSGEQLAELVAVEKKINLSKEPKAIRQGQRLDVDGAARRRANRRCPRPG